MVPLKGQLVCFSLYLSFYLNCKPREIWGFFMIVVAIAHTMALYTFNSELAIDRLLAIELFIIVLAF